MVDEVAVERRRIGQELLSAQVIDAPSTRKDAIPGAGNDDAEADYLRASPVSIQ
jgi:hypothetical protein